MTLKASLVLTIGCNRPVASLMVCHLECRQHYNAWWILDIFGTLLLAHILRKAKELPSGDEHYSSLPALTSATHLGAPLGTSTGSTPRTPQSKTCAKV